MADEHLRRLERRYLESNALDDQVAWLQERVRVGEVENLDLPMLAVLAELEARSEKLAVRLKPILRHIIAMPFELATTDELLCLSPKILLSKKGIGKKTVETLSRIMSELGVELPDPWALPEPPPEITVDDRDPQAASIALASGLKRLVSEGSTAHAWSAAPTPGQLLAPLEGLLSGDGPHAWCELARDDPEPNPHNEWGEPPLTLNALLVRLDETLIVGVGVSHSRRPTAGTVWSDLAPWGVGKPATREAKLRRWAAASAPDRVRASLAGARHLLAAPAALS